MITTAGIIRGTTSDARYAIQNGLRSSYSTHSLVIGLIASSGRCPEFFDHDVMITILDEYMKCDTNDGIEKNREFYDAATCRRGHDVEIKRKTP